MGIFSSKPKEVIDAGTEFINAANSIIDTNVTTQQERGLLKNQFSSLFVSLFTYFEGQLTERNKSDNEHGSWMTRNIRPIITFISVCAFYASGFLNMDPEVVQMFKDVAWVCVTFWFGSRGLEKILPIISEYNKKLRRKG